MALADVGKTGDPLLDLAVAQDDAPLMRAVRERLAQDRASAACDYVVVFVLVVEFGCWLGWSAQVRTRWFTLCVSFAPGARVVCGRCAGIARFEFSMDIGYTPGVISGWLNGKMPGQGPSQTVGATTTAAGAALGCTVRLTHVALPAASAASPVACTVPDNDCAVAQVEGRPISAATQARARGQRVPHQSRPTAAATALPPVRPGHA